MSTTTLTVSFDNDSFNVDSEGSDQIHATYGHDNTTLERLWDDVSTMVHADTVRDENAVPFGQSLLTLSEDTILMLYAELADFFCSHVENS